MMSLPLGVPRRKAVGNRIRLRTKCFGVSISRVNWLTILPILIWHGDIGIWVASATKYFGLSTFDSECRVNFTWAGWWFLGLASAESGGYV